MPTGYRLFRKSVFAAVVLHLTAPALTADVAGITLDGIIHPVSVEIVRSGIRKASRDKSEAVLIRLDTPGGLLDSTRQIVEEVLQSPVPVLVWVGPGGARAASAGFFILESADIAAMAPGTNTGASNPVSMTGGDLDTVMKQKVENDAAALMRSIAAHRGRNVDAAEKTVRESVSYSHSEALNQHLIDIVAADPASLLRQLDGRRITRFDGRTEVLHFQSLAITPVALTLRQRILVAIADPNIALLLLVVGALGIYAEFAAPGLIAPGVIGAMLVLLGLSALALFPIDWLGAALMLLGFTLFVLEAKFATHGILTAGGSAALLLGIIMLIDTDVPQMRIGWGMAIGTTLPLALITSFLFSVALRARRNKKVMGAEAMIGQTAEAVGELNPAGTVMVRGEYWNAIASGRILPADKLRVVGMNGLTLRVQALSKEGTEQ